MRFFPDGSWARIHRSKLGRKYHWVVGRGHMNTNICNSAADKAIAVNGANCYRTEREARDAFNAPKGGT